MRKRRLGAPQLDHNASIYIETWIGLLKARLTAARHNAPPPAFLRSDNGPEFVSKAILSLVLTATTANLSGGNRAASLSKDGISLRTERTN